MTDSSMPSRRQALAAAGAFTLLLTGCAHTRVPAGPVRIAHAQGETVLPALPRRVAVFDLAALDILQAIGVDAVGVPGARFPDYLSAFAADKYPRIGTLFEPDYVAVRATRPDLIIVAGRSASKLAELNKIAPTIDLSTSTQTFIASVVQNILLLGRLFDRQAQAAAKSEQLLASVRQLHAKSAKAGKGLLLFAVGSGLNPQPAQTRFGILYELVGITPAITAADLPAPQPRQPAAAAGTPEAAAADATRARAAQAQAARLAQLLAQKNPDWLFVLDRPAATGGEPIAPKLLAANAAVAKTTAGQKQQIILLDAPTWYLVGGGVTALENSIAAISAAFDGKR
ncbi:MAG: ABC transporter substrate-binding protein [Polaromonas sp.]|nr:ABC transporter substrate-binding protein [Polaromonas sp.]